MEEPPEVPAIPPHDVSQRYHYQPILDPESEFAWHHPDAQKREEPQEKQIDITEFHDPWDIYRGHIPANKQYETGTRSEVSHHTELGRVENQEEIRKYVWEYQAQEHNQHDDNQMHHTDHHWHHNPSQQYEQHWQHNPNQQHDHNWQHDQNQQHDHHWHHNQNQEHEQHWHNSQTYQHEQNWQDNSSHQHEHHWQNNSNPHEHHWQHNPSQHYEHHWENKPDQQHEHWESHHDHHALTHNHDNHEHHHSHDHSHYHHDHNHDHHNDYSSHSHHHEPSYPTHDQKQNTHIEHSYNNTAQEHVSVHHVQVDTKKKRTRRIRRLYRIDVCSQDGDIMNGRVSGSESDDYEDIMPRHPYDGFYLRHRVTIDARGRKICSHQVPPTPSPSPPPDSPPPVNNLQFEDEFPTNEPEDQVSYSL